MPNYHPAAQSLIHGLSDFWAQYFKELPLLEEMYRGVEIDLGQAYLDLLTLLLNNSVQDTALFNREYFKLLRLREDATTYASDGRFGVDVPSDVVSIKYVNNRVFGSTTALEQDRDFVYDSAAHSILFYADPFGAYRALDLGALSVVSRVPRTDITIELVDTGAPTPVVTRTDYAITVSYDAPTATAATLVAVLNTSELSSGLLRATLPLGDTSVGASLVTPTGGPLALQRQNSAPLDGFATRTFDVVFGTRFIDTSINWLTTDVQRGDVLRLLNGTHRGQEFPISLVRDNGLFLYSQAAPETLSAVEYVVLRSPVADRVEQELLPNPFTIIHDASQTVTVDAAAATLTFDGPVLPLNDLVVGDLVMLSSGLNAGTYRIREVLPGLPGVIVDGNGLVDETLVSAVWLSNVSVWSGSLSGELFAADANGIAVFTDPVALFTPDCGGGVLVLLHGGAWHRLEITQYVSTTEVWVRTTLSAAASLNWALAPLRNTSDTVTPTRFPPNQWLTPGEVTVLGRRYLDDQVLEYGRDYDVDVDAGRINPRSVWRAGYEIAITYSYRDAVYSPAALATASNDAELYTTPLRVVSAAAAFTPDMAGQYITLRGAAAAENNGAYLILSVDSTTQVSLEKLSGSAAAPDANNGSLSWDVQSRGTAYAGSDETTTTVTEIGAWSPDVLVDKYHLYYTYGYLINRVQTSSEAYRALIRGVFQLFVLGPTLERFESAISVVAGLPVVREDGEILLEYSSGAERDGTDGEFDGSRRLFTSVSANFVHADLELQLFIVDGPNRGRTYGIAAILSTDTVLLTETPTTSSGVSWELTRTGTQTVTTSKNTYTYPRAALLKDKILEPSNWGVLELRAFEVLSAVFTVTDYVETPRWWEHVTIPEELLTGYTPQRRQSTPTLFENVIGPADDGHIGDPGFFIGADSEGVEPDSIIANFGIDGLFYGDPLYPSRKTETYFESASAAFTAAHVGYSVDVYPDAFRIVEVVSATRVKIVSHIPLPYDGGSPQSWVLRTHTLPMRHTAAYIILDRFLKHHLFSVTFDAFLLDVLQSDVISDLQTLVFEAKPSYTYLVLTPSLLFDEIIRVTEPEFAVDTSLMMSGQGGEIVDANHSELYIDGSWTIGGWFRLIEETGTFTAPLAALTTPLGAPVAGYEKKLSRFAIDPATYTRASLPVPYAEYALRFLGSASGGEITIVGGEARLTTGLSNITNSVLLNYVELDPPAVNAGVWRIGRVIDGDTVVLDLPGAVAETGIDYSYYFNGTAEGICTIDSDGRSFFTRSDISFPFQAGDVGSHIRRPFPAATGPQVYRIAEFVNSTSVIVAEDTPVGDITLSLIDGYELTLAAGYFDAVPVTRTVEYYLHITSGTYIGDVVRLTGNVSPATALGATFFAAPDTGVSAQLVRRAHYTEGSPGGLWQLIEPLVIFDNRTAGDTEVTLPITGVDAGTVDYVAYGALCPIAPPSETYDASLGDTYYMIGGMAPYTRYTRNRTALDVSLVESPLYVGPPLPAPPPPLEPVYYITEDEYDMLTEDNDNMIAEDAAPVPTTYLTEDGLDMYTEDDDFMETE